MVSIRQPRESSLAREYKERNLSLLAQRQDDNIIVVGAAQFNGVPSAMKAGPKSTSGLVAFHDNLHGFSLELGTEIPTW